MNGWSPDKTWREECGIFAAFGVPRAAEIVGLGLHALQHRGQESTGIVSCDPLGEFHSHKGLGLVSDVFDESVLSKLSGKLAIGHNRYSTSGSITLENTQPLRVVYRGGPLALAHNGNLVNARDVRRTLEQKGSIFQTTLDTEILLHLMALSSASSPEAALIEAARQVHGAWSLVLLAPGQVLAFRDPHGFRPLCVGTLGEGWIVASETCAGDLVGAEDMREVEPGELLRFDEEGMHSSRPFEAAGSRKISVGGPPLELALPLDAATGFLSSEPPANTSTATTRAATPATAAIGIHAGRPPPAAGGAAG